MLLCSPDYPQDNGNNGYNQNNMDEATCGIPKKTDDPAYDQYDGDDV